MMLVALASFSMPLDCPELRFAHVIVNYASEFLIKRFLKRRGSE